MPTLQPPEPVRPAAAVAWHARPFNEALREVESDFEGLSSRDAAARLLRHGRNELPKASRVPAWKILLRQVNSALVYVLIASAALAVALGKVTDGLVVFGVVVLNALIGFVQEFRAGKAIEALDEMVADRAVVRRDGKRLEIPAAEVVPGDVVLLEAGDRVSADMRLVRERGLTIDEAALTGESVPVTKSVDPVSEDAGLGDRSSMAYCGTMVTAGNGRGLVVATGLGTELGRISSLLQATIESETPLTRSLAQVGRKLTIAIVLVAVVLFGVGLWRGYPLVDAVLAAITLAVAAIPEGLPAIITIALAIGVQRMARRRAVVRRLPAVETLGSTTVICTDKTGTLTRNEMTVRALWTSDGDVQVEGFGYAPLGDFTRGGRKVESLDERLLELLRAGALCSDAEVREEQSQWRLSGDPTEGALVVAAWKAGLDVADERRRYPRRDVVPFESARRFMATQHDDPDGGSLWVLKGAPEVVVDRCAPNGWTHEQIHSVVESYAKDGLRVLAFAVRRETERVELPADEDIGAGFELLGLQAMIDPPREEAIRAVAMCREAGIQVVMITGDHHTTAGAIGRQIDLGAQGAAMIGRELDAHPDEALPALALERRVFARVSPEHKLRLVRALQDRGDIVAMTGDGVNDAPALKQANIGVAMGRGGTAAAREASDIVLADDNFASIAAAVEEGRRVYDNLVKALAFVLPTNLGEALIILLAVLFFPITQGEPLLPMLPVQILWINLVATVTLALPLAFEAMEPNVMQRPPRSPRAPLLGRFVVGRTVVVALLMAAGAIGLFLYEYGRSLELRQDPQSALREAQTMAVTTVVLMQAVYLLHCRSLTGSVWEIGLFSNRTVYAGIAALLLLQAAFVYVPFMNRLFGSAPLDLFSWGQALIVALVIVPVIWAEKRWFGRRRRHQASV